jgi:hypothetical protein
MFHEEDRGVYLFHYTRLSTAIEKILPSLALRFGRFSEMQDPRESQWAFTASFFGDISEEDEIHSRIAQQMGGLTSTVRVLSLTEDRPPGTQMFGRGFAHPRLWEHYASKHAGVCLALDRAALVEAVTDAAPTGGRLVHGSVKYRDGAIATQASGVVLNEVTEQGLERALDEHLTRHAQELFFTKLTDWESEVEYRFVITWEAEDEFYVKIHSALKGSHSWSCRRNDVCTCPGCALPTVGD